MVNIINDIKQLKFITAFQLFKMFKNNMGKLITQILLTEECRSTQFYDKANEYRTLDYTKKTYRE